MGFCFTNPSFQEVDIPIKNTRLIIGLSIVVVLVLAGSWMLISSLSPTNEQSQESETANLTPTSVIVFPDVTSTLLIHTITLTTPPLEGRLAFIGLPVAADSTPFPEGGEGVDILRNLYLAESGTTPSTEWHVETLLTDLVDASGLTASPDGKRLAFTGVLDDTDGSGVINWAGGYGDWHHVYVFTLANGSLQNATGEHAVEVFDWSPDGQSIVYADASPFQLTSGFPRPDHTNIYIADLDGSSPPRLITSVLGAVRDLALSPDGRFIAYAFEPEFRRPAQISLLELAGGQITDILVGSNCGLKLLWSPDSRWLAFVSCATPRTLSLVDTNTWATKTLLDATYINSPSWSPDGKYLAVGFAQNATEPSSVSIMNAEDGSSYSLAHHPAGDGMPLWSPDGQWILFSSARDKHSGLYLMNSEGGNIYPVLDGRQWLWLTPEKAIWLP